MNANSGLSLLQWRGRVLEEFTKTEQAEFEVVLQELRFAEMSGEEARSQADIDAAVRARVDGRTIREVLVAGYEHQHRRLMEELTILRGVISLNVDREPVDVEAKQRLETHLERQVKRQDALTGDILRIEARMVELGAPVAKPLG